MSQIFFKHSLKLIFFQGRQDHPEGFGSVLEPESWSGCFASEEGKESGLAFDRPVSFISWKPISGGSLSRA